MSVVHRCSSEPATQPVLYDVMSITKAAIGVMYHVHRGRFPRNTLLFDGCTIGDALNHVSGYTAEFDHAAYRVCVEDPTSTRGDLYAYCRAKLATGPPVEGERRTFHYSDYMYQVLASHFTDIVERFSEWFGLPKDVDWSWEKTGGGEALGPHGLHLSRRACQLFGDRCRRMVLHDSASERQQCRGYSWSAFEPAAYWNGWWYSGGFAVAHGYVSQFICIPWDPKAEVAVQVYLEDWASETTEADNRFHFVKQLQLAI